MVNYQYKYIIFLVVLVFLAGCSHNMQESSETTNVTPSAISANTSNSATNSVNWEQVTRLRYIEGTVSVIQEQSDGTILLSLNIIKNYHSDTDPVENPNFPFDIGSTHQFVLQKHPQTALEINEDIIIYECDAIVEKSDKPFAVADFMYLKQDNSYIDDSGIFATVPPRNYPEFQDVFNN